MGTKIPVYLEIGKKRTFACALDWPGWSRSGRDSAEAQETLLQFAPRYARAIQPAQVDFPLPEDVSAFVVIEQLEGNATTDFGAPNIPPKADLEPVDEAAGQRLLALLDAAWQTLDAARTAAAGRQLRLGPRGGGRNLEKMIHHVYEASRAYLSSGGWKAQPLDSPDPGALIAYMREQNRQGLLAALSGSLPAQGPRGGVRWTPCTFVRRSIWHILDHVWEIEDRVLEQ